MGVSLSLCGECSALSRASQWSIRRFWVVPGPAYAAEDFACVALPRMARRHLSVDWSDLMPAAPSGGGDLRC